MSNDLPVGNKHDQQYQEVPLSELYELEDNPRIGDMGVLHDSMDELGFYGACIVDRNTMTVLAGNHRLQAARDQGYSTVPCILVDGADGRGDKIALVDNHSNDRASYDVHSLLLRLQRQGDDLAGTGYTSDDVADLLAQVTAPTPEGLGGDGEGGTDDQGGDIPEPHKDIPATTKDGDVWTIGPHRIICGSCRDADIVTELVDGRSLRMAFTSPPYADRRKYDEDSAFKPIKPDEFVEWFKPVADNVMEHLADDGSWFVNIKAGSNGLSMETYVMDLVRAHYMDWGWNMATEYCWERLGVPLKPSRRFKNAYEPVYQFTRPGAEWMFNPDDVRYESDNVPQAIGPGAGDTNWAKHHGKSNADRQGEPGFDFSSRSAPGLAYPSNRLPSFSSTHEAVGHGAAFPVGLPAWFAKVYTAAGDAMFDPFTGSGSTIIAAAQEGRVGLGSEISPAYVDIALYRIERATGIVPQRDGVQVSFVEMMQ